MSVTVTIDGLDKFLAVCDPARFTKEMDQAVTRASQVLRDQAKKMPPVSGPRDGYLAKGIPVAAKYGGTLRQSIQARKVQLLAADVVTGVNYGIYVHDGHRNVPARPYYQWLLDDFGGKEMIEVVIRAGLDRVANP